MYENLRRYFYWPHTVSEVYSYVEKCESCRGHRLSQRHQRWMQLLLPGGPLELVAVEILGSLTKKRKGNCFVIMMTDRYRKRTKAIPTVKTRTWEVETIFHKHWIAPYGVFDTVL